MAETTTSLLNKKKLLASMLTQEILKKGDEIPEKYLHRNGFPEAIDATDGLWSDDLLIDFSLLSSFSGSELAKLRSALFQWGCLQIINHGIESAFLDEMVEISKQFFALPLEEKLRYSSTDDIVEGYGTDSLFAGNQILNWNDRLFLSLLPKEKLRLECWPQKPEKLRGMIDEYTKRLTILHKVICKAIARSLGLEENCLNWSENGPTIIRFNLYPRCPCPELVLGTKPHPDTTTITYLLQEKDVQGLQILKDDQWYKVMVVPGAIFINFGDLGEVLTNGVFKSAVHRVSTNLVKDRISVAVFFIPGDNEEVEPLSELCTAEHPQVYKKFTMVEYWRRFRKSFMEGSRALDEFQV